MEILSNEKMNSINGGGRSIWFIIGGIGTFLLGFLNGFVNPKNVTKEENYDIKNEELAVIDGGGFTATFFNSIARLGKTIYDIGYEVGSSVRRLLGRTLCKI